VLIFFKLKRNNGELDFPDKAVFYCAMDGKNKYYVKAQIDNVIMPEKYLKNPGNRTWICGFLITWI
jgi:hypothetical protein